MAGYRTKTGKYIAVFVCVAVMVAAGFMCPERAAADEEITLDDVVSVHKQAMELADEVAELRDEMEDLPQLKFIKEVSEIRAEFDEMIVLIAQTDAPAGAKQYAAHVAVGVKSTELSLWYYLLSVLEQNDDYLDIADVLLDDGIQQLALAKDMLEK